MKEPKILFYDIETNLSKFLGFSCGKQVVRHTQLFPKNQVTSLICIQYCWNDGKPAQILISDINDPKSIIKRFDKIASKADVIIGKNNCRFDDKHLATQRMLHDLDGIPDWIQRADDLESQMRRHFYLMSYSLDYISEVLGLGGKLKTSFEDWVNIFSYNELRTIESKIGRDGAKEVSKILYSKSYTEIMKLGKQSMKIMTVYGGKDAEDTRAIWNYCIKHFKPKFKQATHYGDFRCNTCGSSSIYKNGTRVSGQSTYQAFYCRSHGGYAGRACVGKDGKLGKMS